MILDRFLSKNQKITISVLSGIVWIYFRNNECYSMIPRKNIFPMIFVGIWIYLNYQDPLFLPIGLLILVIYSKYSNYIKNIDYKKDKI